VFKNGRALETVTFTDHVGGSNNSVPHAIFDFELEGLRLTALNAGGCRPSTSGCRSTSKQGPGRDRLLLPGADIRRRLGKTLRLAADKFGVYWQVVPEAAIRLMNDLDREKAQRARQVLYSMKKIILADIEAAHAGRS